MRWFFIVCGLCWLAGSLAAGESDGMPTVREKLLAKMMQTAPLLAAPEGEARPAVSPTPVVMMERVVVREDALRYSALGVVLGGEERKRKQGAFSIIRGGTLLKKDLGKVRVELGSWGESGGGLGLLRLSW